MPWTRGLWAFVLLFSACPAGAQFWGGCVDALGRPVRDYSNPSLQDIARSRLAPSGEPIIEYNPNVVLSVGPATRRFFYLHECGHHALGQVTSGLYFPYSSEQAADCWAAQQMRRSGFSVAELRQIQQDISRSPGDWSHLPGPQRALNLVGCLSSSGSGDRGCRPVTRYEMRQVLESRLVPQQMPCQHCGPSPWGFRCLHAFDLISVPVQVPVVKRVPVTVLDCDR